MLVEGQLVERFKIGEAEADDFEMLFNKYQPIVFKMQKEYYLRSFEYDDWLQEARIVFFQTLKTFDFSHGLSLGCFFKMNFKRHVFSLIRRQNAQKRKIDCLSVSLEEQLETAGEFIFKQSNTEVLGTDYVVIRDCLTDFCEQLSALEKSAFYLFVSGKSYEEISACTNCSEEKVKNAVDRVKRKMKTHIN